MGIREETAMVKQRPPTGILDIEWDGSAVLVLGCAMIIAGKAMVNMSVNACGSVIHVHVCATYAYELEERRCRPIGGGGVQDSTNHARVVSVIGELLYAHCIVIILTRLRSASVPCSRLCVCTRIKSNNG